MNNKNIGISNEWYHAPLEKFCEYITYGFTNPMPTTTEGPYMVTAKDINKGKIQYKTARRTYLEKFNKDLTPKSKPGVNDLLITKDGTLGRMAIVDKENICINQSVAAIRLHLGLVDVTFMYYLLTSPMMQQRIMLDAGGSTIKHIYITKLGKMDIKLPMAKSEQKKIASVISSVDRVIESTEEIIEQTEKIKKGLMQQLLTKGIGHTKFKKTEVGEIPAEWNLKKVGEISNVIRGASPRPKGDPRFYGGEIPRLMVADVTRDKKYITPRIDFLTEEGAKRSRPMKAGSLVVVCSGTVGIPGILAVDACIHDGFLGISEISEVCTEEYLFYCFTSLKDKLDASATHGGVFTNLTTSIMKDFKITLPPKKEQYQIVSILSSVDKKVQNEQEKLKKLKNIKIGLMQDLLTGKVRVKADEEEVTPS
ncbi:restriction endonuclease subunit S [Bacillus marasmi]|uniref:restriction endonuclease subunit S n=1 Tax=Bacillus marasmi TaxID=1926279 RepID=UPI001C9CFB98|nr:restriction endonuclease subunit S [Bacillus marasmi]